MQTGGGSTSAVVVDKVCVVDLRAERVEQGQHFRYGLFAHYGMRRPTPCEYLRMEVESLQTIHAGLSYATFAQLLS